MKSHIKAYAFFLGFALLTAVVVKPALVKAGVPGAERL